MPFPFTAIMVGLFEKILAVLMSLAVSMGMITYETRSPDDPPADPSAPYVFETYDEYVDYYHDQLHHDLYAEPGEEIEVLERQVLQDGFTVCLCKNGTAAVTGVTKSMKTARFPSSVEGYPVVAIINYEDFIDVYRVNLHSCTSVIVPNTVEFIGGPICFDAPYLQNLDLGERVRWIFSDVAYMCVGLQRIRFPGSLDTAGSLSCCYSLKEIEFCSGIRAVDDIEACDKLSSVRLPDTVEEIGSGAFRNCGLSDIYIPASVTEISRFAFQYDVETLTVHGVAGSYAESWAAENGISFTADY